MKSATWISAALALSISIGCQIPVLAVDLSSLVQNVSQNMGGWSDVDNTRDQLASAVSDAENAGQLTKTQAADFRAQLAQLSQAEQQAQSGGRIMSFVQSISFKNQLSSLATQLDSAIKATTAALPDVDAMQSELAGQISNETKSGRLSQQVANDLSSQLRQIADIEAAFKESNNGQLSPRNIEIIAGKLNKVKADMAQQVKLSDSGIPQLQAEQTRLAQKINDAIQARKITADQAAKFRRQSDELNSQIGSYAASGNPLSVATVLTVAQRIDAVGDAVDAAVAANGATATAANVPQPVFVQPQQPPFQPGTNMQGPGSASPQQRAFNDAGNASMNSDWQSAPNPYSDVAGYWGEPYVRVLAQRKAIGGFPNGTFKPNDPITRAQFAAIVVHALNLPSSTGGHNFNDVSPNSWAAQPIAAAADAGLITGFPDGSFRPNDQITRAQALVILAKAINSGDSGAGSQVLSGYSDASTIPAWAIPAVTKAANSRIIVNFPDSSLIRPNDQATRGEVAALTYQTLARLGQRLPNITIGVNTNHSL